MNRGLDKLSLGLQYSIIWPFSSGSIDCVKVRIGLEVKHDEILDFDPDSDFPGDHSA